MERRPAPSAPSPARRRRLLRAVVLAVVLVLVAAAGTAYGLYRHLDANIASADISTELGTARPAEAPTGAENILVLGSDSRAGTGTEYGAGLTTAQSDTMLLVHLAADRRWAAAVSIPRDSWVSIPSCTGTDGTTTTPRTAKINEAFTLGSEHGGVASGAACSIKTVEAATGLRVDHFVVVDFAGVKAMTTALGGVPVCTTNGIVDPRADLVLPAGKQVVSGEEALGFVRTRHSVGDGSDLGRIGRQQQFLASMARTAQGELTDPPALYAFLDAATKSITTDSALGSLTALASLARSVQSLPTADLQFFTVPNHPRSDVVKSDHANVLWSQPSASALFADLASDTDPTTAGAAPSPSPSPSPSASASPSSSPSASPSRSGSHPSRQPSSSPSASASAAAPAPVTTGADTTCTPT